MKIGIDLTHNTSRANRDHKAKHNGIELRRSKLHNSEIAMINMLEDHKQAKLPERTKTNKNIHTGVARSLSYHTEFRVNTLKYIHKHPHHHNTTTEWRTMRTTLMQTSQSCRKS